MNVVEKAPQASLGTFLEEENSVDRFIAVIKDFFLDVAYQEEKLSEKGLIPLSQTSFLLKKAGEVALRCLLEKSLTEKKREAVEKLVLKLEPSGSSLPSSSEKVIDVTFSYFSSENDLFTTFFTLLSTLYKSCNFTAAEALVKLIIEFVKMDGTWTSNPLFTKMIELIQGHVTTFSALLCPIVISIPLYQEFFDSYLEMVALRMQFSFSPEMSLQDKYKGCVLFLNKKREEPPSEGLFFALRHLAFLTSRYEWPFFLNRFLAIEYLELMLAGPLDGISKEGISLQIVLQEIELLFQSIALHHEVDSTALEGIIKKLLTFLVQGRLTFSDAILASYLRFLVTLEMEKRCKECPKAIKTLLSLLEGIIEKGKAGGKELSLLAKVLVDVSDLEWIFYAFFVGSNESLEKSRQKLAFSESVSSMVADFEIKEKLKGFHPDSSQERRPFLVTPSLLSLLQRLKLFVYGNFSQFVREAIHCQYDNKSGALTLNEVEKGVRREELFEQIQKEAKNWLSSQNFSILETNLSKLLSIFYKEAVQVWNKYKYDGGFYPMSFLKGIDSTQESIDFKEIYLHKERSNQFFCALTANPFLVHLWLKSTRSQIKDGGVLIQIPGEVIKKALSSSEMIKVYNPSPIFIFHLFVKRFSSFLLRQEGNPEVVYQIHEILGHIVRLIDSQEFKVLLEDTKKMPRKERERVERMRHHVPTLLAFADLTLDAFSYITSQRFLEEEEVEEFFSHLCEVIIVVDSLFDVHDPEKLWWAEQFVKVMKNYADYVRRTKSPYADMQHIKIFTFLAEMMKSQLIRDSQEGPRERTMLFSRIPDDLEGIKRYFSLGKENIKEYGGTASCIIASKCHNLIENQQVEKGLSLYAAYKDDPILKKISVDKALSAREFRVTFYTNFLKKNQLNWAPYYNSIDIVPEMAPLPEEKVDPMKLPGLNLVPEAAKESMHASSSSLKKEILEGHKEIEKRKTKKQEDKLARNKEPRHDLNLSSMMGPSKPEVKEVVKAISSPTIPMKEKVFEIFMRFFEQNDPHEQGPWENRSYRSDIPVKRPELLKVIEALNGEHHTSRKGSSHSIAHLPKTTLKGIELGLNDRDEGELLITLTKDIDLKYYLISQVRKVFIQCGFTPDTVFAC